MFPTIALFFRVFFVGEKKPNNHISIAILSTLRTHGGGALYRFGDFDICT